VLLKTRRSWLSFGFNFRRNERRAGAIIRSEPAGGYAMKTLGLCFVLFASLTPLGVAQISNLPTQNQSNTSGTNLDNDAMKKLLESYRGSRAVRTYRFKSDSQAGELELTCGTMRTYRVKREAPDSDVVRPSGYTTCVPMAKFRIEEAVPKLEADPAE
jgi:hypothetical protein